MLVFDFAVIMGMLYVVLNDAHNILNDINAIVFEILWDLVIYSRFLFWITIITNNTVETEDSFATNQMASFVKYVRFHAGNSWFFMWHICSEMTDNFVLASL